MLPLRTIPLRPARILTPCLRLPRPSFRCSAQARTYTQTTRRPLAPSHSPRSRPHTRHYATFSTHSPFSPRTLLRNHPIAFPFALGSVLLAAAGFAYGVSIYMRMYREMGSYPEKVGLKLRRAIYFTDVSPDPAQAMKAYIQALQIANELGMSPLCNEVIGIKTELVRFLEKTGNPKNALDVLEALKKDCLAWIETASAVEKATVTDDITVKQALGMSDSQILAERTRLLGWACKAATRIASLQANAYISNPAALEQNLTWAVNTTIRERQRREREGVKAGEGEWLTLDEQGSQLEQLAHFYEEKNEYYFAGQLFLQALRLKPEKDCHAVVLMNNLAIALAQQLPPVQPGSPAPSRAELAEAGRTWAMQALALAGTMRPPERTEECDVGCAVATHNLGEFAEMMGDVAEARRRYEEAMSLSRAIGFEEGGANANEGLRRLDGKR